MSNHEKTPRLLDPDAEYKVPEPRTEAERLLRELSKCAMDYRTTKDLSNVEKYKAIYSQLVALGWNGAIDIEDELPDELMPPEYLSGRQ